MLLTQQSHHNVPIMKALDKHIAPLINRINCVLVCNSVCLLVCAGRIKGQCRGPHPEEAG